MLTMPEGNAMTLDVSEGYEARWTRNNRRRVLPRLSVALLESGDRPPSNEKATP